MVRNTKTEKAHRALSQFLRPKLRPGANIEFTPLFVGVNDQNVAGKIDDVIGGAIRLTCGDLTCDAVVPELRRKLKQAVDEPDGTISKEAPPVDEDIVDRVLRLLESRLTPSELQAVKAILTKPPKTKNYDPANLTAEDARNARLAYDARFPNAARVKIEPSTAPAPQRQTTTPNPASYFERFPNARRIGLA